MKNWRRNRAAPDGKPSSVASRLLLRSHLSLWSSSGSDEEPEDSTQTPRLTDKLSHHRHARSLFRDFWLSHQSFSRVLRTYIRFNKTISLSTVCVVWVTAISETRQRRALHIINNLDRWEWKQNDSCVREREIAFGTISFRKCLYTIFSFCWTEALEEDKKNSFVFHSGIVDANIFLWFGVTSFFSVANGLHTLFGKKKKLEDNKTKKTDNNWHFVLLLPFL